MKWNKGNLKTDTLNLLPMAGGALVANGIEGMIPDTTIDPTLKQVGMAGIGLLGSAMLSSKGKAFEKYGKQALLGVALKGIVGLIMDVGKPLVPADNKFLSSMFGGATTATTTSDNSVKKRLQARLNASRGYQYTPKNSGRQMGTTMIPGTGQGNIQFALV